MELDGGRRRKGMGLEGNGSKKSRIAKFSWCLRPFSNQSWLHSEGVSHEYTQKHTRTRTLVLPAALTASSQPLRVRLITLTDVVSSGGAWRHAGLGLLKYFRGGVGMASSDN